MSDEFRRLLDEAPGTELRAVLESGLRDQPSPRTLSRAAGTLGIGAAGLGSTRAAAAVTRALHASPWPLLAKWGAAGVVLGGVALSPFVLTTPAEPPAKLTPRTAPRARAAFPQSNLPESAPTQEADAAGALSSSRATLGANSAAPLGGPPAAIAPSAPVLVSSAAPQPLVGSTHSLAPASIVPNASDTAAPADLLDGEVALLDSTRAALKRGDPTAALALLDRYAQLGVRSLGAEATLLRVQALVVAGQSAEARTVARAALAGRSGAPYAARLRTLAGLVE